MKGPGAWIGIGITVLWLGVMAHLVRNHLMPGAAPSPTSTADAELEFTRDWKDIEEYMLLMLGNKSIGAFSTTVKRNSTPAGYAYDAQFRLGASLKVGPFTRPISLKGAGELDSRLKLDAFQLVGDLAGLPLQVSGLTRGEILMLKSVSNNQAKLSRIDVGREVSLLEGVRPAALRSFKIEPGNTLQIPVVDTLFSMQRGVAQLVVKEREMIQLQGRETQAYRVEMRLNDFVSTSWVDRRGTTLKRQLIGNLTMERTTREEALRQSGVIGESLAVAEVDPADFKDVPVEDLQSVIASDKNPLSVLSGGGS